MSLIERTDRTDIKIANTSNKLNEQSVSSYNYVYRIINDQLWKYSFVETQKENDRKIWGVVKINPQTLVIGDLHAQIQTQIPKQYKFVKRKLWLKIVKTLKNISFDNVLRPKLSS